MHGGGEGVCRWGVGVRVLVRGVHVGCGGKGVGEGVCTWGVG